MDRVDQDYLNAIVNASTSDGGEVKGNVDIRDDGTTLEDVTVSWSYPVDYVLDYSTRTYHLINTWKNTTI